MEARKYSVEVKVIVPRCQPCWQRRWASDDLASQVDEHGADHADALDATAFEDEVGVHRPRPGGRIDDGVALAKDDLGAVEPRLFLRRSLKGLDNWHSPILPAEATKGDERRWSGGPGISLDRAWGRDTLAGDDG